MIYPWSQIQHTELAHVAHLRMNDNDIAGCSYHNNQHVYEMYQYLEDTNVPYDYELDWAVQFHDAVYDSQPLKEYRSMGLFIDNANGNKCFEGGFDNLVNVGTHIMATKDHTYMIYQKETTRALIRADLHALTDKVKTAQNFVKIMNESMTLYDCTVDEFAAANIEFMEGLHDRVHQNIRFCLDYDIPSDKLFFYDIAKGIELTIRLAKALKDH